MRISQVNSHHLGAWNGAQVVLLLLKVASQTAVSLTLVNEEAGVRKHMLMLAKAWYITYRVVG